MINPGMKFTYMIYIYMEIHVPNGQSTPQKVWAIQLFFLNQYMVTVPSTFTLVYIDVYLMYPPTKLAIYVTFNYLTMGYGNKI